MTQLPDLRWLPLQPTGVLGDADPQIPNFKRCTNSSLPRLKHEYKKALKDPDPSLANTLLTWTNETRPEDDVNTCPYTWTFFVQGGAYEIFVRFPDRYPFYAPYYYIATYEGVWVGVKEYLHFAAKSHGVESGSFALLNYVNSIFETDLTVHTSWSPAKNAIDFVKRINNDERLAPLLMEAHLHHVHGG